MGKKSFDFVTEVSTRVTIDVLFSLLSLPRENERACATTRCWRCRPTP